MKSLRIASPLFVLIGLSVACAGNAADRLRYNYSDAVVRTQTASGFSVGRSFGIDASNLLTKRIFLQFGGGAQFYDGLYSSSIYMAPGVRLQFNKATDFYVLARLDATRFEDDAADGVEAGDVYLRNGAELGLRARYSKRVEWQIGGGYTRYADGDFDYGSFYGTGSAIFSLTRSLSLLIHAAGNDTVFEPGLGLRYYWTK